MPDDRREALEALVKSAGWLIFKTSVARQWEQSITSHMEKALNSPDDNVAVGKLRQIMAAKNAVLTALHWPEDELRKYEMAKTQSSSYPSRRGAL